MLFYRGEKVIAPVGLIHTFSQIFFTTIRSNIVNALCFSVANIFFLVEFLYSFFLSDSHDKYPQMKSFFLARLTIQRAWFVENVKQKTIAIHIWRYKRHNWRKKNDKNFKHFELNHFMNESNRELRFLLTSAEQPNVLYFVFVSVKSFAH